MPRGNSSEIRYKRSPVPRRFSYGPKAKSDYTAINTYEDLLVTDDYGSKFDPRKETPDMNLGPGVLGGRRGS